MTLNYLNNNLELLKTHRPELYEKLIDVEPVRPIPDKNETMKNAVRAVDFLGDIAKEGVFILMGLGMGYFAQVLSKKISKGHNIVVYEPNKAMFKYILSKLDMTPFLSSEKIALMVGDADNFWWVYHYHTHMINGRMWVIRHKNFYNGDKKKCDEFYGKFTEEKRVADINVTTQIGLGKTFMNSIMANLPHIIRNNGVISLKDIAKGKTVVSVGAGPFLESNVERIREMKGKVLVMCVDVALPFLLKHDVVPDIVTGIDPLNDNCALYRDERVKDIPLVCMSQYTHKIIKDYPGQMFFSSMPGNQIFHWLQWYFSEKGHIETFGGSVSHFTFALAQYMGADTIALMGHDFAFKKNYYVGNADRILYDEAERTDPFPDETLDAVEIDNMYGEKVFVKQVLLSFRTVFENKITSIDTKVINLSEGGLLVKGAEQMKVDDFIKQYCVEDIDYPKMFAEMIPSNEYQLDELIGACKVGKDVFKKINKYSLKILEHIHQAVALRQEGKDEEARKFLRKIQRIRPFTVHPLLEIMSGYHNILEIYLQRQDIQDIDSIEDEWERKDAQLMRGLNYYGELSDAINKFLVPLDTLIKELTKMRGKNV
jgi:hypothetical protein